MKIQDDNGYLPSWLLFFAEQNRGVSLVFLFEYVTLQLDFVPTLQGMYVG